MRCHVLFVAVGCAAVGCAVVGSAVGGCAVGDFDDPEGFADGVPPADGSPRSGSFPPPDEGAGGRDGTVGVGGGPALACEAQPSCEACAVCAIEGPCFSVLGSCDASPRCRVALDCLATCFSACAGELTCLQSCTVECNDGTGAVQQANSAVSCACSAVCALPCQNDFLDRCESSFL